MGLCLSSEQEKQAPAKPPQGATEQTVQKGSHEQASKTAVTASSDNSSIVDGHWLERSSSAAGDRPKVAYTTVDMSCSSALGIALRLWGAGNHTNGM